MKRSFLCLLAFLVLLPVGASVAQDRYVQQLLYQLEEASATLASAGYVGILGDGGELDDQTYEEFSLTLSDRSEYAVLGVCDEDCYDLDIELFDGYGNSITRDEMEDDAPFIEFTVTRGGEFTLRVTMYDCGAEPCYFGVGVYER